MIFIRQHQIAYKLYISEILVKKISRMKYSIVVISIIIAGSSCFSTKKTLTENTKSETFRDTLDRDRGQAYTGLVNFYDSLARLNYFDFFGKTFGEAMKNDVFSQYKSFQVDDHYNNECLNYLTLTYPESKSFIIYFSGLDENTKCLKPGVYWTMERLYKLKIQKIEQSLSPWIPSRGNQEEEDKFVDEIKNIDFEKFYGLPIDTLLNTPPIATTGKLIRFIKDGNDCLGGIIFYFSMLDLMQPLSIYIATDHYTHMNLCPESFNDVAWNLNDFRKEALKEIEVGAYINKEYVVLFPKQ